MIKQSFILFSLASLLACTPQYTAFGPQAQLPKTIQTQSTPRFYDTAKDALTWAEFDAKFWDSSAQLVKVEGKEIDREGRSQEWIYYFTSPWKQRALRVTSRREKMEVQNVFFGQDFDASFDWKIDSKKALEIASQNGLRQFPVLEMNLEDRFGLIWEIRSWDGWYRIDAKTGTLSKK